MNEIWYNGKNAFSGICYTPFVAYNRVSDGCWQATDSLSLVGQIVGCGTDLSGMMSKQQTLISNFSQNFRKLEIKQDGVNLFASDYAVVKNIDFDESNYAYFLPFTVEVETYDKTAFSGQYGVVSPENSFQLAEAKNATVGITHKISAKGVYGPKLPVENACDWVYARTGWQSFPGATFIKFGHSGLPILTSISESIDRLGGSCSVEEKYTFDQKFSGYGVLRYVVDTSTDRVGFSNVSINGSIDGGILGNIDSIRERYLGLDLYSLAFDIYSGVAGGNDLNNICLTSGVTELPNEHKIVFSAAFNNDNSPITYVKSDASYTRALSIDGNDSATLSATIKCRAGAPAQRYQNALNYFSNTFNPLSEFNLDMSVIGGSYNVANFKITDESIDHKPKDGEIDYSCTWSVRQINAMLPCYIKDISYTVVKEYPNEQFQFKGPLCTSWNAYGTHISAERRTIQGNAKIDKDKASSALDWIDANIAQKYALDILVSKTITDSSQNGTINFNIVYEATS